MPHESQDLLNRVEHHQLDASAALKEPTAHQEHIWLRQQQCPEETLVQVAAVELPETVDTQRLLGALRNLADLLPEAGFGYLFDDSGQLVKSPLGQIPIACDHVGDANALSDTLLRAQSAEWDLSQQPPVAARLLLGADLRVLAILRHRVSEDALPFSVLFDAISAIYDDRDFVAAAAALNAPVSVGTIDESDAESPLDWLRLQSDMRITGVSSTATEPRLSDVWRGALAHHHQISLPISSAPLMIGNHQDETAQLARITNILLRMLCQMSDKQDVTIDYLTQGAAAFDLGHAAASSPRLPLNWRSAIDDDESLRIGMASPDMATTEAATAAPIAIATRPKQPAGMVLGGDHCKPLLLPTTALLPDLTLGVRLDDVQRLTIELITGRTISDSAGTIILERLVAILQGRQPIPEVGTSSAQLDRPKSASSDEVAQTILAEFRDALASPDMSEDDDFFDHGGHSLVATRVIGRLLSQHGLEIRFADLFSHASARRLAERAHRVEAEPMVEPRFREDDKDQGPFPLSLAQQSLWRAYAAFGKGAIFNIPFALRFLDRVDEQVIHQAFRDLMERHPILRALHSDENGEPVHQVVPVDQLDDYRWFWSSEDSRETDRHAEAHYVFDLGRELPLRLRFVTDPDSDEQILSMLFHHVVLDEWSVNLLMDELAIAYRCRAEGRAPEWSTEPVPFHRFTQIQNDAGLNEEHVSYWSDRLTGAPRAIPLFPQDIDEDAPRSPKGGWVELVLDPDVAEGLYSLAKEQEASLFNVVYAAVATSLSHLSGQQDLVIGTSASGRNRAEFFDTVGYFTTVVAHRVQIAADTSAASLIQTVRDEVAESLPHSEIPLDLVGRRLTGGEAPAMETMFEAFIQIHAQNKLNGRLKGAQGQDIAFRQIDPDKSETLLGLQFEVLEETVGDKRGIRVMMSYRADRYGPERVEQIRAKLSDVFTCFADPDMAARALSELAN
ncbi:condensation domain-containing protein [Ruegeria sp. Ofav3-42]|uniref:condensation domain-containing protein n=1 Tax=Ruegeria sp. Ofav3-42 TaxID=2917759 RepID=UPI001EF4CC43|nr:condensation domain-containing protein [Ruegeria sp. Ofav3-42]MCG7519849.1 condensation domain-containing protein [Ruegeria sp. Ofav3-42]